MKEQKAQQADPRVERTRWHRLLVWLGVRPELRCDTAHRIEAWGGMPVRYRYRTDTPTQGQPIRYRLPGTAPRTAREWRDRHCA